MQFKQSDTRNLRSKSLLNEIETLYDERHEQEEAINNAVNGERQNIVPEGKYYASNCYILGQQFFGEIKSWRYIAF